MIVISLDAVGSRDLPYLRTLPNFGKLWERSAACDRVESVYPSLTYPAHASIVTGRYPAHHGIVNNLRLQPERNPSDWFWQRGYIRGKCLCGEAEKAGYRTAALLWPVTGRSKITYNLPEIFPNRPWQNQVLVSLLNGSPLYELELQRRYGSLRNGKAQPELDNFVQACLLYTLRRYRPGLTLAHFTDVDTHRHQCGVDGPEIRKALARHDRRLGDVMRLLRKMGWEKTTDLAVLGDHCQMDVSRVIYLNDLLQKSGYLSMDKKGRIKSWKAVARDCDGSCYVYVRERSLLSEVGGLLSAAAAGKNSGIERIFTPGEAASLGADPACSFMLEAKQGYYFQNCHVEKPFAAAHGYLPGKEDYKTFFCGAGPHFKRGVRVERMSLVDEGPTLAAILGLDLGKTDGAIIKEMIINEKNLFI